MKQKILSLLRNDRGTTALEFGLISTILFMMIMGIVEFSLIMYASSVLENATVAGSRVGITGRVNGQANVTIAQRDAAIRDEVKVLSSGLLKPENVDIQHKVYNSFNNITGNGTGNQDFGCGNQAVLYTARYNWKLFTPLIGQFFNNGTFVVTSSALSKNEDFTNLPGCGGAPAP